MLTRPQVFLHISKVDAVSKRSGRGYKPRPASFPLRLGLFEMHEFDPNGAGRAYQDISVIDKQAGQCARIMFNYIT